MPNNYKDQKITEYADFVSMVEDIGFMPFSNNCIEFINLSELTTPEQWHTDLPSDPWPWRIQIEQDHKAAYGKLFDKKPGFISLKWYPKFLAARRKGYCFPELYSQGLFSHYAKQIYSLFEEHEVLAAHEIKALGGFTKDLNAKFESAMGELQMGMFITGNGTKRKVNLKGEPYGWPSTAYSTVETWAGDRLMEEAGRIKPQDAMDEIIQRVKEVVPHAKNQRLKRFSGF